MFQAMLENATRICEANFGNMYLRDHGVFRLAAAHNTPAALAEERKRVPVRADSSNFGRMLQTKQPVHVIDLSAEQSYLDRHPDAVSGVELGHIRTILFVPLLKEAELIGAIVIYRSNSDAVLLHCMSPKGHECDHPACPLYDRFRGQERTRYAHIEFFAS